MSTLHQIIQVVENSGEITYNDLEWKQRSDEVRACFDSGVEGGYFEKTTGSTTVGEGEDARTLGTVTFSITDNGRKYMRIARGEESA